MPATPTVRNNVANCSGIGCSYIKMPIFEAVISCNIARRVGGVVCNLNAYQGLLQEITWQVAVGWVVQAFQYLLICATKRSVIVSNGRASIFVTIRVLALTIDATVFHFTLTSKNNFIFQSLMVIYFVA